jgi:hypothetical protein
MLPLVSEFEDRELGSAILKPAGLNDRQIRQREKQLINSYIQMPCRVSFIPERFGKVPQTLRNAIYVELDNLLPLISEYLPDPLDSNEAFKKFLQMPNLLDGYSDHLLL